MKIKWVQVSEVPKMELGPEKVLHEWIFLLFSMKVGSPFLLII